MKLSDLVLKAQHDGLASHILREHCATNFLKTFEVLKLEHQVYIDLIDEGNHDPSVCKLCKLIADLDNVENFK